MSKAQKKKSRKPAAKERGATPKKTAAASVVSKKTWSEWSGRQHKILDEQAERYGIPLLGPTIDLAAVARWIHDLLATHGRRILAGDAADELFSDEPTSPALERKREVDYQLRLRDLAERDKQIVSRDKVRQGLGAVAGVLRQCGDILQKQFGSDALDILNDALADAERAVESMFGQAEGEEEPPAGGGNE